MWKKSEKYYSVQPQNRVHCAWPRCPWRAQFGLLPFQLRDRSLWPLYPPRPRRPVSRALCLTRELHATRLKNVAFTSFGHLKFFDCSKVE